jgi:tRNA(Glu) U13 pseudouridine synthase TruD
VGVTRAELASLSRDLPGARRPVVVPVTLGTPPATPEPPARLRLRFSLQSGSYATVVIEALLGETALPSARHEPVAPE